MEEHLEMEEASEKAQLHKALRRHYKLPSLSCTNLNTDRERGMRQQTASVGKVAQIFHYSRDESFSQQRAELQNAVGPTGLGAEMRRYVSIQLQSNTHSITSGGVMQRVPTLL